MELISKTFDQLSAKEIYEILRARMEIFLLEQRIVCLDLDRIDYESLHCTLYENGKILAYLRAFRLPDGKIKIGRVLSMTHGKGHGSILMRESIPKIKEHFGDCKIIINAQTHAKSFYEFNGFCACSEEFLEEGIPHITMELK